MLMKLRTPVSRFSILTTFSLITRSRFDRSAPRRDRLEPSRLHDLSHLTRHQHGNPRWQGKWNRSSFRRVIGGETRRGAPPRYNDLGWAIREGNGGEPAWAGRMKFDIERHELASSLVGFAGRVDDEGVNPLLASG